MCDPKIINDVDIQVLNVAINEKKERQVRQVIDT